MRFLIAILSSILIMQLSFSKESSISNKIQIQKIESLLSEQINKSYKLLFKNQSSFLAKVEVVFKKYKKLKKSANTNQLIYLPLTIRDQFKNDHLLPKIESLILKLFQIHYLINHYKVK